jgi:DNA polymerase (family X)
VTSPRQTFTLARAFDIVETLLIKYSLACPLLEKATVAGGLRRFEPLVDELIVVGCAAEPEAVIDTLVRLPDTGTVVERTPRRLLLSHQQAVIDVRIAALDEYGTVLHSATGSPEHVAAVRARRPRVRICSREEDVFAAAGLSYIPPELRHHTGEIEAAASGQLPSLVEIEQIRGDLHLHSTYSDGQDPLATMVARAAALGYEYIAITDHSERAGAARTVSPDDLARQRDDIERLREQYPSMAILHGVEVDIMPDGSLDFDDDLLASLDIVLASLHDDAGQSAKALTQRCLKAMAHPLVSIVTHPANQIVGRRAGYALDFPAVYEAAVGTGTALEIDGAPSHMDLDGEHAREAVAAGVTVAIDSDAHRAAALARQMRFGVGTARRGWVEPRQVLNTRSLADVRRFIEQKRSG